MAIRNGSLLLGALPVGLPPAPTGGTGVPAPSPTPAPPPGTGTPTKSSGGTGQGIVQLPPPPQSPLNSLASGISNLLSYTTGAPPTPTGPITMPSGISSIPTSVSLSLPQSLLKQGGATLTPTGQAAQTQAVVGGQAQQIMAQINVLIPQLLMLGRDDLALQGKNLSDRCQGVLSNPSDPAVPQALVQIQSDFTFWQMQAQAAVSQAAMSSAGGYGGGSGGGGGGGDDGGGHAADDDMRPPEFQPQDQADALIDEASQPAPRNTAPPDRSDNELDDVIGELLGHRRMVGAEPAPTHRVADFLHRPLWKGSSIEVWQAGVGGLSAILVATGLGMLFGGKGKRR